VIPLRPSRRDLLRGLAAAAATAAFVPVLEANAAAAPPKRLVFFFSANGTIRESWLPKMAGGALELSPILAPLERHKKRLLVVDGLAHTVILEKSNRSGHSAGMNTALTGRNNKIIDPSQPLHSYATGISLDPQLAAELGARTKLRSIEAGVAVEPWNPDTAALSYRGPVQPIYPESSPWRLFDRAFGGGVGAPGEGAAASAEATAERRRLLEAVSLDLEAVKRRVAASDRVKLDAHLAAVRELGHSLETGAGDASSSACRAPTIGERADFWKNDAIPAMGRLQMDLVSMALACDLTRIATVQFGRAGSAHRFTWLGPEFLTDPALAATDQAKGFHALAHKESEPSSRAKLVKIHTWYAGELAYFLDRLAAVREGSGTLLDNTLVVWLNELGTGGDHRHDRTPWVLAGNVAGFFRTGRLVETKDAPHNRLLLSIAHAMGVPLATFGDPDYCKAGPLDGLVG
jgi:hypothetical protein